MKFSAILTTLSLTVLLASKVWAVPAPPLTSASPTPRSATSYAVKKGDSLYAIARRYGLSVEELKRLNGLAHNTLKPGQTLLLGSAALPAGGINTANQPVATPAGSGPGVAVAKGGIKTSSSYTVRKGDSLYAIARRHGLPVGELKRLNNLRNDSLKPGQKLLLGKPGSKSAPAITSGPDPATLLRQAASAPPKLELTYLEEGLEVLEKIAFSYLSTPYRFGGGSRKGIDCSNFVRNVFRELNIDLPRTAREQYHLGAKVTSDELQSGDLLFFRTYAKYPSHVGIYLGDQKMIHASPRSRRVVIASVDTPYFRSRFIGAKRLALLGGNINIDTLGNTVEEDPGDPLGDEIDPSMAADGQ